MESERALICLLLDHIRSLGLISEAAHSAAVNLARSAADLPPLFQYPADLTEGGDPP